MSRRADPGLGTRGQIARRDAEATVPADRADKAGPRAAVESYLLGLVALCDDPPLIDELVEADLGTARGTAAIARAALAWLVAKQPYAIETRIRDELAVVDLIARYRIRQAGLDVHAATGTRDLGEDSHGRPFRWSDRGGKPGLTPAAELARLHRYEDQPERTPDPWPPESLDAANLREVWPPSPNVPPRLRFRRHDAHFRRGAS